LPFDADELRATSVADRPGDWGPIYDRVMTQLNPNDIVTLSGFDAGHETYLATNHVIFDEALALARQARVETLAVVAWEGGSRGSDDTTAAFAEEARQRGLRVL